MKRILILLTLLIAVCVVHADRRALLMSKRASGPSAPVADLLWWKLNEGSGTTITATTGPNGTHDADYVTGESGSGNALQFTRSSSDNAASDSALTIGTNVFTITARMYFTTTNEATQQTIIEQAGIGSETNVISIGVTTGGLLDCLMKGVGFTYREEKTTSGLTPSAWTHVMIVFDGSANDIKVYLNGSLASTSIDLNTKTSTGNFNSQIVHVGSSGGTGTFFNGRIDDLRFYTGDRSADVSTLNSETSQ